MTEVSPNGGSQLDRIDGKLDQVLDRLTRMEERQDSQSGKIQAHDARLDDLGSRLREVEIANAVSAATGQLGHRQLKGRWAAIGSTALVILGAIGAFVGNAIVRVFGHGGP